MINFGPAVEGETSNNDKPTLAVSLFDHARDNVPKLWEGTWTDLVAILTTTIPAPKAKDPGDAKKAVPAFSGTKFEEGATRSVDTAESISLLVFDFDNTRAEPIPGEVYPRSKRPKLRKVPIDHPADLAEVVRRLRVRGLDAVVYTTWSDSPALAKFRVVVPLQTRVHPSAWLKASEWAIKDLGLSDLRDAGAIDLPVLRDVARMNFLPCSLRPGAIKIFVTEGAHLNTPDDLSNVEMPKAPTGEFDRKRPDIDPGTGDNWWKAFPRVDFKTLDLPGLLIAMGVVVGSARPWTDGAKWRCHCPWAEEHTHGIDDDCAVIFAGFGTWPVFNCAHSSHAGLGLRDIVEMAPPELLEAHAGERKTPRAVVKIHADDVVSTLNDIEAAILAPGEAEMVFSFAGSYACVRHAKPVTVRDIHGGTLPPMPVVHCYSEASMRDRVGRSVRLERASSKGDLKPANMSADLAKVLLSRGGGQAPPLTGILDAPTVRMDGTILDRGGYDPSTGLFVEFNSTVFPAIHSRGGREGAQAALRFLEDEFLAEFPFAEKVDRSVAVAALATGLVRSSVGVAPGFLFSAPAQGTGKSALAFAIAQGAFGRPAPAAAWPATEEEMTKFILSVLREGQRAVVFDNIRDGSTINSPQLAAALTSDVFSARILGVSSTASVGTGALWIATGNNVRLAGDMPSRILKLYLDSGEARPDCRSYRRDLVAWVAEHRPRIVAAALTIIKTYLDAGAPKVADLSSRFPAWDRMVRLPLIYAGGADVAAKFTSAYDDDPILVVWTELFEVWHEVFGTEAVPASKVMDSLPGRCGAFNDPGKANRLDEAIRSAVDLPKGAPLTSRVLGTKLSQFTNRNLGGLQLTKSTDGHDKTARWRVAPVK